MLKTAETNNSRSVTVTVAATSACADAYFIGVHGTLEGPDENGKCHGEAPYKCSATIQDTWKEFKTLAWKKGKRNIRLRLLAYPAGTFAGWVNPISMIGAKNTGVSRLDYYVRERVLKECPEEQHPKIVLVGYSLGAWVIDNWLLKTQCIQRVKKGVCLKWKFQNEDLWEYISAVELYGDPMWYRSGPAFPGEDQQVPHEHKGLARYLQPFPGPYERNQGPSPQGKGDTLSNRWQSRCLVGDPVCGEGYKADFAAFVQQALDVRDCPNNKLCLHLQYHNPATGLTRKGAKFLALKTFPEAFKTGEPRIAHYETSVEGDHV